MTTLLLIVALIAGVRKWRQKRRERLMTDGCGAGFFRHL